MVSQTRLIWDMFVFSTVATLLLNIRQYLIVGIGMEKMGTIFAPQYTPQNKL